MRLRPVRLSDLEKFSLSAVAVIFVLGSLWHEGLKIFPEGSARESAQRYVPWLFPKNESVWAHQLIFAWPFLLVSVVLFSWRAVWAPGRDVFLSRAAAFALGLFLIPTVFLWYTGGDVQRSVLAVDILLFFVATVCSELLFLRLAKAYPATKDRTILGVTLFALLFLVLIVGLSFADFDHSLFRVAEHDHD